MAWPPPTLPTTRANTTVMADTHPAEHNAENLAINDIVARVGTNGLSPWVSVGPTLTMGTTPVSLAANDSRWCYITNKLVRVEYSFIPGGYVAGAWTLSRPVAGRVKQAGVTAPYAEPIGQFTGFDVSAGAVHTGFITPNLANGSDIAIRTGSPAQAWSNTVPFSGAAGDVFQCWFEYEPL